MSNDFVRLLLDPETSSGDLLLEIYEEDEAGRVRDGRLISRKSGCWYRIGDYIVDLLPPALRSDERYRRFATRHGLTVTAEAEEAGELRSQRLQMNFYKRDSLNYDNDVSDHPYYKIFGALYRHPWIGWLPSSVHIPDVSGGIGRQALPPARRGHRGPRTNISEAMLRIAVRKTPDSGVVQSIDFVLCGAENLPVVSRTVNAATCYGVLHHIANPGRTLAHAGRVLKPGGLWFHDELAADEKLFNQRELSRILSAPQKGIHE
jgi:2-polyprenyl-3-methyl-5-hydroxy-6-metoxy-1,4-benzoquinol methylase/uncharacterized protein YbaR (Trm112 family)